MGHQQHISAKAKNKIRYKNTPSPLLIGLLKELHHRLRELQSSGQTYCIDVHSLPLKRHDHEQLEQILGKGEIGALINAMGPTRIREAGVPGIWWVVHYDIHNKVIAELLEITTFPDLLRTQTDELNGAIDILRERIAVTNVYSSRPHTKE